MSYAVLIMCYKRVDELRQVVESVQNLNPSCIYFHVHAASSHEDQDQVEAVLDFIENYQGEKVLKYVKEPLGIYLSMASALNWVAENEESFFVFEDDVPIIDGSARYILAKMQELQESKLGILKFGLEMKKVNFWGWAITASAVPLFTNFSFENVTIEDSREFLDPKSPDIHLKGIKHLYANNRPMAWDDEYDFIAKYLKIPVIYTDIESTNHIGHTTTRGANGNDVPDNNRHVTFINGVIQL